MLSIVECIFSSYKLKKLKSKEKEKIRSTKLPKAHIYWQCVCDYLDLKSIARFEYAMSNHKVSLDLGFGHSFDHERCLFSPYETLMFKKLANINIDSVEMISWCERRNLHLPNITLTCKPEMTTENVNVFANFFIHVKSLTIDSNSIYPNKYELSSLFSHILSFESLNVNNLSNDLMTVMINQSVDNSQRLKSITPGPHALGNLILTGDHLSSDRLITMISSLKQIHSIKICSRLLKDSHLELMNQHWPHLTSISFEDCRISDVGLHALTAPARHFKSLEFRNLVHISLNGLSSLLKSSCNSLQHLSLTGCPIQADDFASFVCKYRNLQSLTYFYISNVDEAEIIPTIVQACPNLFALNFFYKSNIQDNDILAMTQHCHQLTEIGLGQCTKVSISKFQLLADTYRSRLRSVAIDLNEKTSLVDAEVFQEIFANCHHRVDLRYNYRIVTR
jgi:hypothetical protein